MVRRASGEMLFARAERTEGIRERMRGLLGRKSLDEDQMMWIDRCDSVHTFAMKFAIDLAYLDGDGAVRKVVSDLVPSRVSSCWRAAATLEMRAGSIERFGLVPGERVEFIDHQKVASSSSEVISS